MHKRPSARTSCRAFARRSRLLHITPVAAAVALAVPVLSVTQVAASPVDEQRDEVERVTNELENLQEEASKHGEQYAIHLDESEQLKDSIKQSEQRVADKEAEVASLRDDLSAVAADAFVNAGTGGLGPVFEDQTQRAESMQAEQFSHVALDVGATSTDDLDEAVSDLNEEKAQLEEQRQQAEDLAEQASAAKEAADTKIGEYEQLRQEAEAELGRLIEEEEQRRAEEAYRQMLAEQEAAEQEAAEQAAAEQAAAEQAAAQASSSGSSSSSNSSSSSSQANLGPSAPAPAPAPTPAPSGGSSQGQIAVNAARSQVGVPYRWGAAQPGVAFDCSGLTMYAWAQAGVSLPHQSRQQAATVPHVSPSSAAPGDLIFAYSPISHVGIYIGGGQQIAAPYTGSSVRISSINWSNVSVVGRPG